MGKFKDYMKNWYGQGQKQLIGGFHFEAYGTLPDTEGRGGTSVDGVRRVPAAPRPMGN